MPGGIGEEDFLTLVLPYIKTAREGERLGALLEEFGTYEMNGVAFSDVDEIWWLRPSAATIDCQARTRLT